jgi:hypothetical protein
MKSRRKLRAEEKNTCRLGGLWHQGGEKEEAIGGKFTPHPGSLPGGEGADGIPLNLPSPPGEGERAGPIKLSSSAREVADAD